ncbi:hypothetical protein, partial [Sinorhizobium saheli]
ESTAIAEATPLPGTSSLQFARPHLSGSATFLSGMRIQLGTDAHNISSGCANPHFLGAPLTLHFLIGFKSIE